MIPLKGTRHARAPVPSSPSPPGDQHDAHVMERLIRIETKLSRLMEHQGLNPRDVGPLKDVHEGR